MAFRLPNFRSLSALGLTELRELCLRALLPRGYRGGVSIGSLPHRSFRLDAASGLYDPARNSAIQRGDFWGFIFGPAVLWPAAGGIADGEGRLVAESFLSDHFLRQVKEHRLLRTFPMEKVDAPYVTCIGHIHRNYFHRHIDSIPRLYGLRHPDLQALESILLLVDHRFSPGEMEIIECLLPGNVRVRRVDYATRFAVKQYIHLPFLSGKRHDTFAFPQNCAGYLPQEYIDLYRETLTARWQLDEVPGGRRIFISRARAKIRRLVNEEEIRHFVRGYGFEVHEMEGKSLREQAEIFAGASHILTTHGAALTNLLYANPASTLIEVFAHRKVPIYLTLAKALGMGYVPLALGGPDKNADVLLPVKKLRAALERAGL